MTTAPAASESATSMRQRAFGVYWSEIDRWIIPASVLMGGTLPEGWTTAKVGDLVELVTDWVQPEPEREYKMAGVKWYGQGVFHRETVRGDGLSAKYIMPLKPGALIYNRLFAWKESFAVVPDELANCFVSNEFPQFIPDTSKVLPEYLYLWAIGERTIRAVNAASTGSTAVSRNRFREELFLEFELPLPPVDVQRAIVSAWERKQAEVTNTRRRIAELEEKVEADFLADLGLTKPQRATLPKVFAMPWREIERWGVQPNQLATTAINIQEGTYPVVSGRDCFQDVRHGCSASPSPKPTGLEVLKISAVTRGLLDVEQRKFMYDRAEYRRQFDLNAGDVLLCRTNGTLGLVGMSALVERDFNDMIFPDKVIRIRPRSNIRSAYLWKVLQMPFARSQIEAAARTAVGNYAIGSDDLWKLRIPLPPTNIQDRITKRMKDQQEQIAALRQQAEQTAEQARAEAEAMILGEREVSP